MAITDLTTQDSAHRIQDFIFARELAEVYLLLDHLSGRSDKALATVISEEKIKEICEICWPPRGTTIEQAAQAATLMLAKDALNTAAKPANSASIAFTLMVVGDEDLTAIQRKRDSRLSRWLRAFWRSGGNSPVAVAVKEAGDRPPNAPDGGEPGNSAPAQTESAIKITPVTPRSEPGGGNGTGASGSPSNPHRNGQPPSRVSLARCAYPGLIRRAALFNFSFKYIIIPGLFFWLILTCFLSWDIAAGRAILAHIDALETARTAIRNKIAAAETTPSAASAGELSASGVRTTQEPSDLKRVVRFCDRPQLLPPAAKTKTGIDIPQFDDATERQICDEFTEINSNYSSSREDVADWLAPWRFVKIPSHQICGGEHCVAADMDENDLQWAVVMVQVLTTAVLPLFYGFLGAGAAVVRIIWGKMRDSLLTPRDLTLSLGQLALGAVIGACIGLFIVPSGNGSQNSIGLVGVGTLTPSAVSFIAGFGVEGVFVALESLIKRLFNIPDPKP